MTDTLAPVPTEEAQISLIESSVDFDVMKNPYDRMEYVHLTDRLIHRLEGSEAELRPDFVLFLDKSARPVSWLTTELWDTLAREPGTTYAEGIVPKKPQFLFLNIDSKHSFGKEDIPGLRSLFTLDPVDTLDGVEQEPTFFQDKRVLVVDEIGVSHATRVKAVAYMQLAFPEATVDSYTWMDQGPDTNYGGQGRPPSFNKETFQFESEREPGVQASPLKNNLRWYKDRSLMQDLTLSEKRYYDDGRGIIEHDSATQEELAKLDKRRIRLGRQWLSIAPSRPMPESIRVRNEMKMIAEELKAGTLPYWPSEQRNGDDVVERCENFNHIDIASFTEFRVWFKATWWRNWNDAPVIAARNKPDQESYRRLSRLSKPVVDFAIRHALFAPKTD